MFKPFFFEISKKNIICCAIFVISASTFDRMKEKGGNSMRGEDKESLVETMDKYEKIMKKIAINRAAPSKRTEIKIEGTVYTHLSPEEFLREFTEWLEKDEQSSRFIGEIREKE